MPEQREIVVPGERVGGTDEHRPGQNTYVEGSEILALRLGVKSVRGDRVNVISLNGRYEPQRGDMVIGTVAEAGPSNWYINIGASNDVGMHVNDVPWRVEFGETTKYLDIGDTVLLKIVHVDELKKAQVSMKDRQCRKLTGGLLLEVSPSKVPRIVGRQGSMIGMIKDATNVRLFVGQNGHIWLDGEPEDVQLALEALRKIEAEAHTSGLTDRMKAWLEERRPEAQRPKRAVEETEEAPAEDEEERPRRERRERPERAERPERPERAERRERPERPERPQRRARDEEEDEDQESEKRPPRRERRARPRFEEPDEDEDEEEDEDQETPTRPRPRASEGEDEEEDEDKRPAPRREREGEGGERRGGGGGPRGESRGGGGGGRGRSSGRGRRGGSRGRGGGGSKRRDEE